MPAIAVIGDDGTTGHPADTFAAPARKPGGSVVGAGLIAEKKTKKRNARQYRGGWRCYEDASAGPRLGARNRLKRGRFTMRPRTGPAAINKAPLGLSTTPPPAAPPPAP